MSWTELWIDPKTGEVVDPDTAGAVLVAVERPEEPPEAEREPDSAWLPDWLTRRLVELEALEEAQKEQHARQAAELRAKRLHLERYLPRMEAVVTADLRGAKKRSVGYRFATAGYRSSVAAVVEDEAAALTWADEHCPAAVKVTPDKVLTSELPKGAEVPGVRVEERETFYVGSLKVTRPKGGAA